jgi:hypothetical protein
MGGMRGTPSIMIIQSFGCNQAQMAIIKINGFQEGMIPEFGRNFFKCFTGIT